VLQDCLIPQILVFSSRSLRKQRLSLPLHIIPITAEFQTIRLSHFSDHSHRFHHSPADHKILSRHARVPPDLPRNPTVWLEASLIIPRIPGKLSCQHRLSLSVPSTLTFISLSGWPGSTLHLILFSGAALLQRNYSSRLRPLIL
jgi:hypothetical protein